MTARFQSLQVRFLASLVLSVAAALATVAIVARWSTTAQFEQYVQANNAEMQQVAQKLASNTGQRVIATNAVGRVFIDSSSQLLGKTLEPSSSSIDPTADGLPPRVMVFSGSIGTTDQLVHVTPADTPPGISAMAPIDALPPLRDVAFGPGMPAGATKLIDPEELFLSSFNRSLLVGVLVGGVVALALAVAFSRGIVRSVEALTAAARRMATGHLDQRVTVRSRDEIGELGHAFNALAEGLTRTEQLRRTMVADVAHELRTPLTNLRGYLEALRDGVAEPGPDVLASLYDESVLLSQLVDDLQDLALSDAGQLTLHRELVDAGELFGRAVRAVQPEAVRRGITVQLGDSAESVLVWADVQRIGQVLRNLLANAVSYTLPGGRVTISSSVDRGQLRVDVADTGRGIPSEHLGNVFERFYRVDGSRARATGGAGIGLAIVKQLVEAHGGRVSVRSMVDEGSTFSFTLPLRQGQGGHDDAWLDDAFHKECFPTASSRSRSLAEV